VMFPGERTARGWLVGSFVAPLLLAAFATGGVLAVEGRRIGPWIAALAWLAYVALIGVNGWVYRRVEHAREASRGRVALSTRSTVLVLFPSPTSIRAALASVGVNVSSSVSGVVSVPTHRG
jgi:hypothetical protein